MKGRRTMPAVRRSVSPLVSRTSASRLRQRKAVDVRHSWQIRCRVRPQRHLGRKHRDAWGHRHHRPAQRILPGLAVVLVTFGTRVRARGAEDELHEVGWLQSRARGHPPKDETPGHLLRRGRCFSRDEDGELVERDCWEHVAAVAHDAEPLHEIHRWRCGPRDVRNVGAERRRAREAGEGDRRRVAQVPIRRDVDRERSGRSAELDASRARSDTHRRDQLYAIEIATRRQPSLGAVAE